MGVEGKSPILKRDSLKKNCVTTNNLTLLENAFNNILFVL